MTDDRSIAYLCLEAPREGQASYVHVHEIIAGLRRRGWHVELLAPKYQDRWQRPNAISRAIQYAQLQCALMFKLRKYRAIYVRAHPLAFPLAWIARWRRTALVHEVNGTYGDLYVSYPAARRARGILDGMQRLQYRWAAGVICVTPQLAKWVEAEADGRTKSIDVIPNGANVDLFSPAADVPVHLRDKIPERYVVFFGGLTRWHGVPLMLRALTDEAWPQGVSLVVIGDGPEAGRLAEAATDARLIWLGRLPYAEIGGIVARAIAGLVPISDPDGRSSAAGLAPLKLYETLACAVPAIVTDFPGQADLVREHDCGVCVAPDDSHALAQAVAYLGSNPDTAHAMGKRGHDAVRARHSWDSRAQDTADFIQRTCAKSGILQRRIGRVTTDGTAPSRGSDSSSRFIDCLRHLARTGGLILLFAAIVHLTWTAAVSTYATTHYARRIYDVTRFGADHWNSVQARLVDVYVASHLERRAVTAVGSSFTFGYSFDERYTFTAALNRRQISTINVSVVGYTALGIYQTLCSIQNRKANVDTLIVEIPLVNETFGLANDYPKHWKLECYPIPTESLFSMMLRSPQGIGWSRFLFDPYARSAPFETANIASVPKGYFVSSEVFHKIEPSYLANVRDLIVKAQATAKNTLFFVTPVYMNGVEKAGADKVAVREQYDLSQQFCRNLAGDHCVATDRMLDDPTLFSNITHINGKGASVLADLIASKLAP